MKDSARSVTRITMLFVVVLFCACLSSQHKVAQRQPLTSAVNGWETFVDDFIDAYFAIHPDEAVVAGRHEFDGKLPDWSRAGIEREIKWLRAQRDRALGFNTKSLNLRQRFERDYVVAVIDGKLFWLVSAEWPFKNPRYYADSLDPQVYLTRPYAPLANRLRAYTNYAKSVPAAVEQIRNNLRVPLPLTFVNIGRTTFGDLASSCEKDFPAVFESVKDTQLQADFRSANAAAIQALRELDAWIESQRVNATNAFALGAERFREMLRATEGVDISIDRLKAIGQQDLERNLKSLQKECAAYAPGKTIQECIDSVQSHKPDGGAVKEAARQLPLLKQFIRSRGLLTIPAGSEEALVAESPPYQGWNAAYINTPGPYEKGMPSTYYVAAPDPKWSPEERQAYIPGKAVLLFTSVHEVWPGHFLQFLQANRSSSKFGQVFVGYAFAEGWAHYAEELMWETGIGKGESEIHIGQLLEALLRNVRFLSAIGLHTGGMTVADSERMFRELAYQDPGNARQQAARGTFDPAYLNYTLGKLMIRNLREDWTASRGGRKAWRAFHDQFLSYGGPPIPLVRKAMLGPNAGPPLP